MVDRVCNVAVNALTHQGVRQATEKPVIDRALAYQATPAPHLYELGRVIRHRVKGNSGLGRPSIPRIYGFLRGDVMWAIVLMTIFNLRGSCFTITDSF